MNMKKLSSEWSQIQIADNISDVTRGKFSSDSNAIVLPHKMDGDFEALTNYLIKKTQLADDESTRLDLHLFDTLSKNLELSEAGRLAAKNLYETASNILDSGRTSLTQFSLQGKNYSSLDENWHTDGTLGQRRVGCRVSGNETEIAHQDDVIKVSSGETGYSEVKDSPRTTTYGLGNIWANKAGKNSLFSYFDKSMEAVTHRKSESNGKPGLIFTTNLDL